MQFSLNNLKPYAETMRAWLVNLSVASMAVGLFNGVLFEVVWIFWTHTESTPCT